MKKTNRKFTRSLSLLLTIALLFSTVACSKTETNQNPPPTDTSAEVATPSSGATTEKIINIGVTDALGTLNPLLQDGGELNKYATNLLFLPLVDLDKDLNFVGVLADSITTTDNKTFTVTLRKDAVWSDGTPVTADDLIFTVLRLTSPAVGNTTMAGYAALEGFDENGLSPEGAESIAGVVKVDAHTVTFTAKESMSLMTFQNSFARYLFPLPKHILGDIPAGQLTTDPFFNAPTVVDGPFTLVSFDRDHYISYAANPKYFMGAPKIDKLNFKIVQSSQLYAGLKSGEIDFVQPTMAVIQQEDYESVQKLENIRSAFDQPLTNELVFFNTKTVSDPRLRQAILYAANRSQFVSDLLGGNGEVVDGFLTSFSPYFDSAIVPTPYDLEKAKALVQESGWDTSKELEFLVNGGDSTLIQAGSVMAATLAEIGVKVKITTVDFSTIFTRAQAGEFDLYGIQYTIPPVDPYADVQWLAGTGNYSGYSNPEVDALLAKTQQTNDVAELKTLYSQIDHIMQTEVPLFSAYVVRPLGAVRKQLVNVEPNVYGAFLNVNEWDIANQ